MGQVGDDDVGPAPGRLHLLCDLVELSLCAGRDEHVGTGFGESQSGGGTQPAPRPGDDRDLVVEAESVQNHVRSVPWLGATLAGS